MIRMGSRAAAAVCALTVAALLVLGIAPVRADDYVLGPEDVVQISVWMHPELEKTVAIGSEGNITYPPLGDIKAAGMTPNAFANRLSDKLSTYLRQTTTVTVTVAQYLSRSVYVSGAVAKPGRYGFERIPTLPDVINAAGGAVPGADMSSVQVVRREGEARRTLTADVAGAMREGGAARLPQLRPGDTVVVPSGLGGGPVGDAAGVIGEVNKPGLYPVGGGQDIWTVLAAAGGLTGHGDLGNVKVVIQKSGGPAVVAVNLRESLSRGPHGPFVIRPGDVVYVSPTGSSAAGRMWFGITQALSVSRDLVNIALIVDYMNRRP
jgi:polysaccharide export outer membrane protein